MKTALSKRSGLWRRFLLLTWLGFVLLATLIGAWLTLAEKKAETAGLQSTRPLKVAVAANFFATAGKLTQQFTRQHGTPVVLSAASSGTLFAHINNGLPYDVFLSADVQRPQMLVGAGMADAGSATNYARGQLVLWGPAHPSSQKVSCLERLQDGNFRHLVIANPETAPYGLAGRQVMQRLGITVPDTKIITAESISQAFHMLRSGNVDMGFIARSQWLTLDPAQRTGCAWQVPETLYDPIVQQAVRLTSSRHAAAQTFVDFLRSDTARIIIAQDGYAVE